MATCWLTGHGRCSLGSGACEAAADSVWCVTFLGLVLGGPVPYCCLLIAQGDPKPERLPAEARWPYLSVLLNLGPFCLKQCQECLQGSAVGLLIWKKWQREMGCPLTDAFPHPQRRPELCLPRAGFPEGGKEQL